MTPEELREIWSKKVRTPGQRAVEHHLYEAASSELVHQEGSSEGLSRLIDKQSAQPTVGGDDKLASSLKAISASATTALVTQRRLGRKDPTKEQLEFGKELTACVPGASERMEAAEKVEASSSKGDARAEAAIRGGVSERVAKKQLRSRRRAAADRQESSVALARARLDREAAADDEEKEEALTQPNQRKHPLPYWDVDEGLGELKYPEGTWICGRCGSYNGPSANYCEGWLKGEACGGTYYKDFQKWAPSQPAAKTTGEKKRTRHSKVVTKLEEILQQSSWNCEKCGKGNLAFRYKCYKCSRPRPKREFDSSDDEWCPQESAEASKASERFLEQKRELRLRGKRKRAGRRHKSKGSKKKRKSCARGPAAELAFRGSRAARKKRSKKKVRRHGWAVSRKARNKKAHADNGNGFPMGKLSFILAAFMAPVVRKVQLEVEEIVETSSAAFQVVIAESGEELASFIESGFGAARMLLIFLVCWWISRKVANSWVHMTHGNPAEPKLSSFDGNTSVWEVKGSKETHRVRISGNSPGCACRLFLSTGRCHHVEAAMEQRKKLTRDWKERSKRLHPGADGQR